MRRDVRGDQGSIWLSCFRAGLLLFGLASISTGAAQEDSSPKLPSFDVVSIRPYTAPKPVVGGLAIGRSLDCHYFSDRIQCTLTPQEFIQNAFNLKKMEVAGPASLSGPIFTLNATMPPGTTKDTARLMLQRVLADRFELKFHYEARKIPVYAMVPGKKGVKLQPAADPAARGRQRITVAEAGGRRMSTVFGPGHLYSTGMSLDLLAANLGYNFDLPVVNATGLTGEYRMDINWSPSEDAEFRSHPFSDPEFLSAMQEQAGLRLEKRSIPVKVLVVDHIDSVPSEN